MYVPAAFGETRVGPLIRFIDDQGLASLVHADEDGIDITHVPVLRAARGGDASEASLIGLRLEAHVARANPLVRRLVAKPDLTVAWLGANSYVSAEWYGEKPAVPTWNYMAVHLHCRAVIFEDRDRLQDLLKRTADWHEPRVGGRWTLDHDAADYADQLLPGIVGIDLVVESHEAIFKLHQNHPAKNANLVADALARQPRTDCHTVSTMMREKIKERSQAGPLPAGSSD
ncbi:FMN-binding negative transcriptional regulator [Leisingera daeponensis]|uniref:FMN-binding negative transcriptional regulator n=1 Tax=Leisingera daeponensis TaxID=405746 RepID=A0ABS7NLT9_9RHOB|nr:FMN-binding negative transcriptional regulator [Leisingera daeponensis]MBY6142163.1 FMN-binding negative transcriptional regulator [Leisingera daeponensis]